jgi:dTDP-4-dehydrorhamnose 3,5-epimerase
MKFQETKLKGCYLIDLDKNKDHRNSLNRIFCQKTLSPLLKNKSNCQINRIFIRKEGAVRGLHFQNLLFAEIKIVSYTKEEVWDVAIDLRKGSPTFLHYYPVNLSESNPQCFFKILINLI